MPFAAALSTARDTTRAAVEVCTAVRGTFSGHADLAVLFFSPHHAAAADALAADVQQRLNPGCLIGCSGEAVVANDQEIERSPAVSLWVCRWARRVAVEPFQL